MTEGVAFGKVTRSGHGFLRGGPAKSGEPLFFGLLTDHGQTCQITLDTDFPDDKVDQSAILRLRSNEIGC